MFSIEFNLNRYDVVKNIVQEVFSKNSMETAFCTIGIAKNIDEINCQICTSRERR